jgi:hypothetical protein
VCQQFCLRGTLRWHFTNFRSMLRAATTLRGVLAPIVGAALSRGGPVFVVKCGEDRL